MYAGQRAVCNLSGVVDEVVVRILTGKDTVTFRWGLAAAELKNAWHVEEPCMLLRIFNLLIFIILTEMDTHDILDGEVAVAELEEADIEEEVELVEITRVTPPGKLVGAHVSMSNGIARAVINAASIGKQRLWHHARSIHTFACLPMKHNCTPKGQALAYSYLGHLWPYS